MPGTSRCSLSLCCVDEWASPLLPDCCAGCRNKALTYYMALGNMAPSLVDLVYHRDVQHVLLIWVGNFKRHKFCLFWRLSELEGVLKNNLVQHFPPSSYAYQTESPHLSQVTSQDSLRRSRMRTQVFPLHGPQCPLLDFSRPGAWLAISPSCQYWSCLL